MVIGVAVVVTALNLGAGPAGATAHYRPPVDAPISDPFRAPANPYGPGNRGIEYATTPGTLILAAGDGVVVFAGAVAGGLYVTIQHPDGVRTSYSWLAEILVGVGQAVGLGQAIGVAGVVFQIGARRGDVYFDPASLWGDGPPHVFLVPMDGGDPPGWSPDATSVARPSLLPMAAVPDGGDTRRWF